MVRPFEIAPEAEPESEHPSGSWSADLRASGESLTAAARASGIPPARPGRYGAGDVVANNYRLVRLLGRGGMGDVWLAHNEMLDVEVAIKLIRGGLDSFEAEERLLQEARAAAKIEHPAIVRVFDFGRTPLGDPFIVMERLEGEDLATALHRRGRVAPALAVRTLLPIVHALSVAHGKGVIHRDLKPENVFLAKTQGERLEPKLVDFGVAKIDRGSNLRLTREGDVLGSPAYMSPEQARGEEADHRADVWALCVVLYEIIEGRRPFAGTNHHAVLHAIVRGDLLSPVQLVPPVGGPDEEALWAILSSGLDRDLSRRFQTARALGEALASFLLGCGVTEDISGASLEAVWKPRPRDPSDTEFAAPVAASNPPPSRATENTVRRRSIRPSPHFSPFLPLSRRVAVSACVAAFGIVALGAYFSSARGPAQPVKSERELSASDHGGAGANAESRLASGSRSVPPATRLQGSRGIPVETLDDIPIDPTDSPENAKVKPARPRQEELAGLHGRRPTPVVSPRPLKDPFQ